MVALHVYAWLMILFAFVRMLISALDLGGMVMTYDKTNDVGGKKATQGCGKFLGNMGTSVLILGFALWVALS